MYARVARFEGGSADEIRATVAEIKSRAETGPPEGVPSTGFTFLANPEEGRVLSIGLFETEDDLRKGNEVLDTMDPPGGGMGQRVSVESYEVGFDVRM
jgi:hypothetical protein